MLADAVRLGVIRHARPEACAAGAVVAEARGNRPSASSSRAVITRPKRGYAVPLDRSHRRPSKRGATLHPPTDAPPGRSSRSRAWKRMRRPAGFRRSQASYCTFSAYLGRTRSPPSQVYARLSVAQAKEKRRGGHIVCLLSSRRPDAGKHGDERKRKPGSASRQTAGMDDKRVWSGTDGVMLLLLDLEAEVAQLGLICCARSRVASAVADELESRSGARTVRAAAWDDLGQPPASVDDNVQQLCKSSNREVIGALELAPARPTRATAPVRLLAGTSQAIGKHLRDGTVDAGVAPESYRQSATPS